MTGDPFTDPHIYSSVAKRMTRRSVFEEFKPPLKHRVLTVLWIMVWIAVVLCFVGWAWGRGR